MKLKIIYSLSVIFFALGPIFCQVSTEESIKNLVDTLSSDNVFVQQQSVKALSQILTSSIRPGYGYPPAAVAPIGPGGIRDVEFLVQALQMFHGAREKGLRTGNVPDALRGLRDARILPDDFLGEDPRGSRRRVSAAVKRALCR